LRTAADRMTLLMAMWSRLWTAVHSRMMVLRFVRRRNHHVVSVCLVSAAFIARTLGGTSQKERH